MLFKKNKILVRLTAVCWILTVFLALICFKWRKRKKQEGKRENEKAKPDVLLKGKKSFLKPWIRRADQRLGWRKMCTQLCTETELRWPWLSGCTPQGWFKVKPCSWSMALQLGSRPWETTHSQPLCLGGDREPGPNPGNSHRSTLPLTEWAPKTLMLSHSREMCQGKRCASFLCAYTQTQLSNQDVLTAAYGWGPDVCAIQKARDGKGWICFLLAQLWTWLSE